MGKPYCDPVTDRPCDRDSAVLREEWRQACDAFLHTLPDGSLSELCLHLWRWLDDPGGSGSAGPPASPFCDHARDSYVTDHALLASALVACLIPDQPRRDRWRLALLTHEFPHGSTGDLRSSWLERISAGDRAEVQQLWQMIDDLEATLEEALKQPDPLRAFRQQMAPPPGDLAPAWYAHLAASERLQGAADDPEGEKYLHSREEVLQHPLSDYEEEVALVYGGATKIKDYVFESARLPEVRGASSLLDRINLLDVPALWNCRPYRGQQWLEEGAFDRYQEVRNAFQGQSLDAPECLIYAGGGNFLALAPAKLAPRLADAIEEIYTAETLVGKSVAVSRPFRLLELQYGYKPWEYWLDDYLRDLANPELCPILEATYRTPEENTSPPTAFLQKKTFGQLVTILASAVNRRRAGNGEKGRRDWPLPHYELPPHAMKCHSCDTRPAVVPVDLDEVTAGQTPKVFCLACARKRVTGQVATDWYDKRLSWQPTGVTSWGAKFLRDYAARDSRWSGATAAKELGEIGEASKPEGYVGLVYADGNNVGALVSQLATPSAYRQFGKRLAAVCQEAVFAALDANLDPHCLRSPEDPRRVGLAILPFEILTIGGDDLSLIVPAHKALDIACAVGQKFEELLLGPPLGKPPRYQERYARAQGPAQNGLQPRVALSAGVALARDHTPIIYVEKLADQLLKRAKRGAKDRRRQNYLRGTVEFAALKTTGMVSLPWDDFRRRTYDDDGRWHLTARPYTWSEMEGLLATVRALSRAHFPRTQIYRLQRELFQRRPLQATIDYLYFFGRLPQEAQEVLFKAFHEAWHTANDVPPWRRIRKDDAEKSGETQGETAGQGKEEQYETIWRDLVELYDFARQEEVD